MPLLPRGRRDRELRRAVAAHCPYPLWLVACCEQTIYVPLARILWRGEGKVSLALRVLKSWLSNVLPVRELPDGGSSGGQFLRRRPCNGIKIGLTTGMILGTSGILPSAAWAQQAQPVSIVV